MGSVIGVKVPLAPPEVADRADAAAPARADVFGSPGGGQQKDPVETEFKHFLALRGEEKTLEFWGSAHHAPLPYLTAVAMVVLQIPWAQADVESAFSVTGFIYEPRRQSMKAATLSRHVTTKVNRDLNNISVGDIHANVHVRTPRDENNDGDGDRGSEASDDSSSASDYSDSECDSGSENDDDADDE